MTLALRRASLLALGLGGACLGNPVRAEPLMPVVYRDEAVTVRAGIAGHLSSRVVELGDVLELVITVTFDDDEISVAAPDRAFFDTWSQEEGVFLVDVSSESRSAADGERLLTTFRFQLLGCPGGRLTCPGTRRYVLPEFTLAYRPTGEDGSEAVHPMRFRPWPGELLAAPAIPLDEDNRPYAFEEYFPTGGYPEPLDVPAASGTSQGLLGMGVLALIGGLLMWPFRSRRPAGAVAAGASRWRQAWQVVESGSCADEPHLYDQLRRCVVWYCVDELGEDPYAWVDGSQDPAGGVSDTVSEVRRLFLDVLQNRPGEGSELQARFAALAAR